MFSMKGLIIDFCLGFFYLDEQMVPSPAFQVHQEQARSTPGLVPRWGQGTGWDNLANKTTLKHWWVSW